MACGLEIDSQHSPREVRQACRHEAVKLIGPFEFFRAAQLEDTSVHLGNCYDRNEQARAIAPQPGRYVGSDCMASRIEHRYDIGVEQIHDPAWSRNSITRNR